MGLSKLTLLNEEGDKEPFVTLTEECLSGNIMTSLYLELENNKIKISGPFVFSEKKEVWFYPCGEMTVRKTETGKTFIHQNGVDLFEFTGNEIVLKVDSKNSNFS